MAGGGQTRKTASFSTLLSFLLIAHCSDATVKPLISQAMDERSVYCPLEYSKYVRPSMGASSRTSYYAAGEELTTECHSDDDISGINLSTDKFFVYPSTKRVCLPNGAWSGMPQTCVNNTASNASHEEHRFYPLNIHMCSDVDCAQASEIWQPTGQLHSSCSTYAPLNARGSFEQLQVYVEFEEHVHLSYMTFNLADNAGRITRPFRVEVNVHPEDVIDELSANSENFLKQHYDIFADEIVKKSDTCAITELRAYSRSLLLRFFVEKNESYVSPDPLQVRWRQRPKFYGVIRNESKGCPQHPSIPFGFKTEVVEDNQTVTISFACQPGFTMINPTTNETSDGQIQCYRGLEWAPYPFPICRKSFVGDKQLKDVPPPIQSGSVEQLPMEIQEISAPSVLSDKISVNILSGAETEELLKTPSVTPHQEDEQAMEQQGTIQKEITSLIPESDPMIFVIMGNLLAIGLVCGFIFAFFCLKREILTSPPQFTTDPKQLACDQLHGNYWNHRGYNMKGNRLSAAYTIISNSSFDSSTTEPIYESMP